MAKRRRKTAKGIGFGDGTELLSTSEEDNVYHHRTEGRITGMFQGSVWLKAPNGIVPGSPAAAYWAQIQQENTIALTGKLWAITARGGIDAIGGPSPASPRYQHTREILLQETQVVATFWRNLFGGVTAAFPVIPFGSGGPGYPFGIDLNKTFLYPQFTSGICFFSGYNAGAVGDVLRLSLTDTNSAGAIFFMPAGYFNGAIAMDAQDIANINQGYFRFYTGAGSMPENIHSRVYSIDWRLFR